MYTEEFNPLMEEIIVHHLGDRSKDTITWYKSFSHQTYYELNDDGLIDWMISYFILDFPFDTIIVMQRENKFPKKLWRILKDTIHSRVKPIRIMSDPNNKVLVRGAERNGGEWHQDEIWFY